MATNSAEVGHTAERKVAPRTPRRWAALVPLAFVWAVAILPVVFFLLHQQDPVLAVQTMLIIRRGTVLALLGLGAVAIVAALLFPPFPAWVRRFVDRTRTSWTADRAPLQRALSELQHLETAQRHFEVARLAWIRGDHGLAGPHAKRAVELDPEMAQAHHQFALYLLHVGAFQQAEHSFATAESLSPGHAFGATRLLQARAADRMGKHDRALALFAEHERGYGSSHRSNYWRGEALLAAGQRDEAGKAFAAAAANPKNKLTAEENWFRALARVKSWRLPSRNQGGDS